MPQRFLPSARGHRRPTGPSSPCRRSRRSCRPGPASSVSRPAAARPVPPVHFYASLPPAVWFAPALKAPCRPPANGSTPECPAPSPMPTCSGCWPRWTRRAPTAVVAAIACRRWGGPGGRVALAAPDQSTGCDLRNRAAAVSAAQRFDRVGHRQASATSRRRHRPAARRPPLPARLCVPDGAPGCADEDRRGPARPCPPGDHHHLRQAGTVDGGPGATGRAPQSDEDSDRSRSARLRVPRVQDQARQGAAAPAAQDPYAPSSGRPVRVPDAEVSSSLQGPGAQSNAAQSAGAHRGADSAAQPGPAGMGALLQSFHQSSSREEPTAYHPDERAGHCRKLPCRVLLRPGPARVRLPTTSVSTRPSTKCSRSAVPSRSCCSVSHRYGFDPVGEPG